MTLAHLYNPSARCRNLQMLGETDLHITRYAPHARMAPHEHDAPTLSLVIDGQFTEIIGREQRRYARGTVSFCPAGTVHSQTFGCSGARQIICQPPSAWLDYLNDCKLDLAISPYACSSTFRGLGERLVEQMRHGDRFSALAVEGLMLEVVAAFARNSTRMPQVSTLPVWLKRAQAFMHEHMSTQISLAQIAQAAGRHEIHLAREFRRHFGVPVGSYLRQLRTEQAARLLAQTSRNIAEIALACGFSNHAHLCREFKARFGVTPSQYRTGRG